jgi:TonB family protein
VEEWVARTERPAEIPLPLAPPRLEPLPVGSDAVRPRISPDVFLRRTQAGSLVELREVDKAPIPISRPAPTYPPAARQMRREGEIELRLLVDEQGQVAAVERLTGGRSDLAAAAERAARQWRYRPAMKDGVPVQVKILEKVTFKL